MLLFCNSAYSQKASDSRRSRLEEAQLIQAVEDYDNGSYVDAARRLLRIIDSNPRNDAAHYYLALCLVESGNYDAVEHELKKASEIDPSNFWYRQRLAIVYTYTRQYAPAIAIYERLLEDFPKKSDLYFDLAELYVSAGQAEKALETVNGIETIFGPSESIAVYRYRLLMSLDRKEEAVESLKEYNRKYSSPYILSALGDQSLSDYNDVEAMAYYDEALELDREFPAAMLGKAEILRMTRRYSDYFPMLQKYMASGNVAPEAKADYFNALMKQSDLSFVKSFLPQLDSCANVCFRSAPADTAVIGTVAAYYYTTQRKDAGRDLFRMAADITPRSKTRTASYLYVIYDMQDWPALESAAKEAQALFPDVPDFMELEGIAYYGRKQYDALISNCEKMVRRFPSDSAVVTHAYSTMGDSYHLLGQHKNAYKAYEKALKVSPDNIYVLNNYAYYLSEEGKNLKKAYAMSRKTVEKEPDNATYLDTFGWILYLQGKALEAKPFFKHAMLYGGKDSAVIMDHYAEVLFALKEYDMAFVYWNKALLKDDGSIPELEAKVKQRREEANRDKASK